MKLHHFDTLLSFRRYKGAKVGVALKHEKLGVKNKKELRKVLESDASLNQLTE
mgnify:FL=1